MTARVSLCAALAAFCLCPGCSTSSEDENRRLRAEVTEAKNELERARADLKEKEAELSALKEEPDGITKAGLLVQSGDLSGSTPVRPPFPYEREIKFPRPYVAPPTISLSGKWAWGVELDEVRVDRFSVKPTITGAQKRISPESIRSCSWRAKGMPAKE